MLNHFQLWITEIELIPNHNQSQSHPILILSHSILIIIITDSINIEYTSLNGLESNVLFSFLLFCPSCINQSSWYAISAHSIHILSIDLESMNTNHTSNILFMNCILSVIMPKNHSYTTTKYQSFCTTILSNGIHNKLQFFIQILVIPVAIINCILHATQNKTFHENGNNRIKHCVKPMKWQDRVCVDFVCFEANLCLSCAIRFGIC